MSGTGRLAEAVTWLFVPASRPERFAKAMAAGADVVVIDLEDAVAPGDKHAARENLTAHWPAAADGTGPAVVVRVNDRSTAENPDDLAACRVVSPAAVVLPKTESAEDVRTAAEESGVDVVPLVESARGLIALPEIAASAGVVRLVFGSVDLALELGVSAGRPLDTARFEVVRWSAACGLPQPVDGVSEAVRDTAAVTRSAEESLEWGFGAKLCIHPNQVPLVHAAYAPTEEELAWARRVLDVAGADNATGAVLVDGQMVDRPVVERARRIVRRGAAAEERQTG